MDPFTVDAEVARQFARIVARQRADGPRIPTLDAFVAATALVGQILLSPRTRTMTPSRGSRSSGSDFRHASPCQSVWIPFPQLRRFEKEIVFSSRWWKSQHVRLRALVLVAEGQGTHSPSLG